MEVRTLLLLAVALIPAAGQYTTGRIEGTVLDASGAAIAGSSVTLTSRDTNILRSLLTGDDGAYVFASLPPGRYHVEVDKTGFSRAAADVTVVTSQTATRNITLQVGEKSTAIEVVADPGPDLNASDPLRSSTRSQLELQTLPNAARNTVGMLSLAAGVQPTFNPRGGALVTVSGAQAGQIAANGGRSKATSHQLDFTDANDWEFGGIALNTQPSPDMLQELRVLTSNWSAEYGVKSNAQVIMVTRAGSNALHGSAYDFLQNDALNARDYFDRTGKPVPLKQNYFGVTGGGPVVSDRTFFFGGFEGRETRGAGSTVVASLPTAAARLRASNAAVRSLMDQLLPLPAAPTSNPDIGTLSSGLPNPAASRMFLLRGDHYFNANHSITARYFQHTGTSFLRLSNTLPGFDATFDPDGRNAMLADTWVVNARTTNELRLAYGRSSAMFNPEPDNGPLTPRFVILGLVSFGATNNWPQGRVFNVYQVNDVLNLNRGRHVIKAGFDLRHIQDNSMNDTNRRGVFTFASLDGFLAGQPSNYTQTFGNTYRGFRSNFHGAFVQDDVRVAPTLMLSFGLRWEYQGGLREVNRLTSVLDGQAGGVIGAAGAGPLGGFRLDSTVVDASPILLAPRFGFNWNPRNGRVVVRGGYGIYYDSLIFNGLQAGRTTPPVNYVGTLAGAQISGENGFEALLNATSPFQRSLQAQLGSFGALTNLGRVVTTDPALQNPYVQHFHFGLQYRAARSLVLDASYVATKGTRLGVYGPANSVVQKPAPAVSPEDEQARIAEFRAAVAQQNGPGNTRLDPRFNDVDRVQSTGNSTFHSLQLEARRTLAHGLTFSGSYTFSKSIDNASDYSPGQQTTDASFAQDQFSLRNERAVSSFHIPHRFVLTHVWELPFLRNRGGMAGHVLGGWSISSITQMQSGIPATALAGPRLGITDVNLDGNLVQGGDNTRASCAESLPAWATADTRKISLHSTDTFSILEGRTAYFQPLIGNAGTCGRNTLRMNRLFNSDWSLAKRIRIGEAGPVGSGPYVVEFRADLFNAFNVPFLTATGNEWRTVSSPQFGRYNAAGASRRMQLALRITW